MKSLSGVFFYLMLFLINCKESFGSNSDFTFCESFSEPTGDSNEDQIECNQKLLFDEEMQENEGDKGHQTEIDQMKNEVKG